VAYGVEEAVLFRKEAGRHARVDDESHEGAEVRKSQGAAGSRKGVEGRCDVVVPANESVDVSMNP
jgi:hypothetical protein